MSRRGWSFLAVAALVLAVAAVAAVATVGPPASVDLPDGESDDGRLRVRRGDLVLSAEVSGTLEAVDSHLLGPPSVPYMWNYKISFLAPEGAEVEAGTPVLRFDTSELQRRLQEKVAERDSAATELEKKRVDLERTLRDLEMQLAEAEARLRKAELKVEVPAELEAANELATARLDRDLAAAEVESLGRRLELKRRAGRAELTALREKRDRAEERVAEIQVYIDRLTVRAPRAGTVIYVTDWQGDKRKVGDQVWQANKVVEIPDLTRMQARGQVDESDAGRLAVGQTVRLRLDAHPESEYRGRVEEIASAVTRKDRGNPLKQVELVVDLEETDPERMRPGMRFQGEVEVERAEGVALAPAVAVRSTAAGPVAYRKTLFGVEEVHPRVGRRNEEWVEILDGLPVGAELVRPQEEGR